MAAASINTELGRLAVGEPDKNGVRAFKGIPYAAPPVRDLRWRPPAAAKSWSHVRPSSAFGFNAAQRVLFSDIDPYAVGVSEDCLYLNVWTPAQHGEKLPVLFWIHGGGFAVGSGSEPRYDGARLAAKGIVVVTINTRLNALGFLAHPALTSETGSSGHFALLDAIAALKWVRTNIAQFGGDPEAVTIAGESAGAMFVSLLMTAPAARGLFHRAICQSGAWFPSPERPMRDLAAAEKHGLAFADVLGAKTADELRAVPLEKILDASPGLGFWPVIDGQVLLESPAEAFGSGRQADVPLIAGWTRDEGYNFDLANWAPFKGKSFLHIVKAIFPGHEKEVMHLYASPRDLGGDLVIANGTWMLLESHRLTAKSDVFRYRFDRAPKTPAGWFPEGAHAGAFHSSELPYNFNNLDAFPWIMNEQDQYVADVMSGYWLNFIKTGNPGGGGLPPWPSYRETSRPVVIIDAPPRVEADIDRARHELLARIVSPGE